MAFKEVLERYRNGTASGDEIRQVEEELEKFELLEEYLIAGFDAAPTGQPWTGETDPCEIKKINKHVNRKFQKNILFSLVSVAAFFLLAGFLCNLIFYDPNRGYAEYLGGDGQFFVDTTIFTELHSPGYTTHWAKASSTFPGCYQIDIRQSNCFRSQTENFSGRIVRGNIEGSKMESSFFNPNIVNRTNYALETYWNFPPIHAFGRKLGSFTSLDEHGNEQTSQPQVEIDSFITTLEQLPSSTWVSAYVTFREDISLDTFASLYSDLVTDQNTLEIPYAAVRCSEREYDVNAVGFTPSSIGVFSQPDGYPEETYPLLRLTPTTGKTEKELSQAWKIHVSSMLRYMADRPQFLKAMAHVNNISPEYYREILSYLEENDTLIYGILIQGNVSEILSLAKSDTIDGFYVDDVKLSSLSN